MEAPLVGIRGGGVAAQFRAGDDLCARGEGPDRLLRLDGGRRGISARVVALREHGAEGTRNFDAEARKPEQYAQARVTQKGAH